MSPRQRTLPPPVNDLPDLRTSSDFLAYVEHQRTAAQRRADDHQGEVTALEVENARLQADYETAVHANNVAIAALRIDIDDAQAVVSAAERALDFGSGRSVIAGKEEE